MEFHFIGDTVKRFRERNHMSLGDFAEKSQVSKSMLCQLEAGKTVPTLTVAAKLAEAMGMNLGQLVDPSATQEAFRALKLESPDCKQRSQNGYDEWFLNKESCRKEVEIKRWQTSKPTEIEISGCKTKVRSYLILEQGTASLQVGQSSVEVKPGTFVEVRTPKNGFTFCTLEKAQGYWVHTYS